MNLQKLFLQKLTRTNMEFIIATNNQKKLVELSRILNPLGIKAISAKEAGVVLDDVEETGTTFAENAFLKANAAFQKTGMAAVADDSGLSVDYLDGRPGVYSARYAGENATDEDRYNKLLEEMKDAPKDCRKAHFTSAICCILPNGQKIEVEGRCEGEIAFEPFGNGGFGYDPVFIYNGKSYAELTAEEKDAVSHRGKALRKLQSELKTYLDLEK
jgi:XTP/dITP diphosphohydrolase